MHNEFWQTIVSLSMQMNTSINYFENCELEKLEKIIKSVDIIAEKQKSRGD